MVEGRGEGGGEGEGKKKEEEEDGGVESHCLGFIFKQEECKYRKI